MGTNMKLVFIAIAALISVASATCPAATLANTVISGLMPSAVNPGWMKGIECIGLRATFLTTYGALDARPTCVCASGDTWYHPYWVGECALEEAILRSALVQMELTFLSKLRVDDHFL